MTADRWSPEGKSRREVRERIEQCHAPSNAEVVADLARARSHFQLRALATIIGAPLPLPGISSVTIKLGQSGGQIADVIREGHDA